MMEVVNLDLGPDSYPIYIGSGLIQDGAILHPHIESQQVCVISNTTVGPIYAEKLTAQLHNSTVDYIELPDGEQYKTLDSLNQIITYLLENRHERSTTLIALGGGVIGDITGFAAACYLRGVNFLQVPTTLLAQVDSSVGGKTGVNHPLGKNLIGAFKQPACVLIDIDTLATLPDRELRAGMAEVIKYGAIRDIEFLGWLEENRARVQSLDPPSMSYLVERNCKLKAEIVSADEKEKGIRAILNLGHTFGHAIEAAMGYGVWLHGEAVAAGSVMAADLSFRMGMLTAGECKRFKTLLEAYELNVCPPAEMTPELFIELMKLDKKASAGEIRFVLLDGLGSAALIDRVDPDALQQTLSAGEKLCEG
jgi:3-dehydroquinate synthase